MTKHVSLRARCINTSNDVLCILLYRKRILSFNCIKLISSHNLLSHDLLYFYPTLPLAALFTEHFFPCSWIISLFHITILGTHPIHVLERCFLHGIKIDLQHSQLSDLGTNFIFILIAIFLPLKLCSH